MKPHLWVAISACTFSLISTSALAISVTVGSTTIVDGGVGDTNATSGIIDFSLTSVNGTSGTYNISGTVNETITGTTSLTSGATLTLTNLDIQAITGNVNDTIIFDSSTFPVFALPANGVTNIDGNWTNGASNTATAVTNGDVTLTGWNVGNWEWNGNVGINQEFLLPFSSSSVNSSGGSTFATAGINNPMPDLITPYFGQVLTQADWTSVRGKLEFNLANSGDGLWMPGSAEIVTAEISAVPLPATVWLFASGLTGLLAAARGRKM